MRRVRLLLVACLLAGVGTAHAQSRTVALALARPLRAGEGLSLELSLGPLPPGATVTIATPDGRVLGTISPHGPGAARAGATYVVPIPPGAVARGRVVVRLVVDEGCAARAPTRREVRAVRLVIVPP